MTVATLIELYEAEGCCVQRGKRQGEPMKKRTKAYTLARLRHHVVPLLRHKWLSEVGVGEIERFVRDLTEGKTAQEEFVGARKIRADYADLLPSALACFEDDFEACIAHLRLPVTHRRLIRTANLLKRLFVEERRRLKIIPNGFGEKPALKLMFGALIRAAERWRGLSFTEFELRQLATVRKEHGDEYQASLTPPARSLQPRPTPCFQQIRALTSPPRSKRHNTLEIMP